jgi:4-amino-4-deoxy-L-arabinose transferase-like glycosyltransferase
MEHRMNPNKLTLKPLAVASPSHISRAELILLLLLVLLGFTLRVWNISSVGLDHYDEGAYVFSALGLTDQTQAQSLYPGQVGISPPVFFGIVGLTFLAAGEPSDMSAIFLNVILGTLTIAAVWLVGRFWFSAEAGIAAAALLTFSEYHIALSRTALSDVAFALFFLLALATIAGSLQRQSLGLAIVAGLVVGLAWNTKYHGWFALLISAAALVPFSWYCRVHGITYRRFLKLWLVIAVVAAACYLPWALFIQSQPGGYAAMAKHHRSFISPHWFHNLWSQAQMQIFFEGPFSQASVLIAFLLGLLVSGKSTLTRGRLVLIILLLSISSLVIGGSGTAALVTLVAIPSLLRTSSYSAWLVLSWLAVWFFSTPLYHPYARLVFPFTLATFLVWGFWISAVLNESRQEVKPLAWQLIPGVMALIVVASISTLMPDPSSPWRPCRSVQKAAAAMRNIIPVGSRVIVIGEPPLAFYLHLANHQAFEQTENTAERIALLESLRTQAYVVTGVYSKRAPELRNGLKKLGDRLIPLGTFPMDPKDLRILDDFVPREARLFRSSPDDTYKLNLYLLSPSA